MKTTRNTLTTMLLLGLFLAAPTQAQTPRLAAWHSHRPMNMNREACFTRAQQALRAASFQNILTQEGWNTSGTSTYLHAAISCVAMGDQTLVDVVVAGADAYNSQTAAMRTRLSNYMINCSGGGTDSDKDFTCYPGRYVFSNNDEVIKKATVADCQKRCLELDGSGGSWYCKGFDWADGDKDGIGLCNLSKLSCAVVGGNCKKGSTTNSWYERLQTTPPPDYFVQLPPPDGLFTFYAGRYVYSNNDEVIKDGTVAQCQQRCLQLDGRGGRWYCKGFDWVDGNKDGVGLCNLSKLSCATVGGDCKQRSPYDWYERR